MKNLVKSLISAFVFTTVIAFGASADDKETKKVTSFQTGIFKTKEGKLTVNIDKFNDKPTLILLEDSKGNVLYKEIAGKNQTKMRRLINMNDLPSGAYSIQISSDGEKQTKNLELQETKPERIISMN